MLAETPKRTPHRCVSPIISATIKQTMKPVPSATKTLGSTTGFVNSLVSMTLAMGEDTSQLFETSCSPRKPLDILHELEDLLAHDDLPDPFSYSKGITNKTNPVALSVESSRNARTGSFHSIIHQDLEPTPLAPKWRETSPVATPSLQSTPTSDGALERLLAQEFSLGNSTTAQTSEASQDAAYAPKSSKRAHPEEEDVASSIPVAKKRRCTSPRKNKTEEGPKFRDYQEQQWVDKFHELLSYKAVRGHCLVPHTFDENPALSRWVKRQRYQYKLFLKANGESTMTQGRIRMLEEIGFVWDSHAVAWEERLEDLKAFQSEHGHCNVPSHYAKCPPLAVWVKRQRRQVKLFWKGERSTITPERFATLRDLGFTWELRRSKNSF